MLKEGTFKTNGLTINVAEGPPAGPPLVLIHGGGDRWQYFLPVISSLAKNWQVHALDLRGHGKSGRVPGHYRPEHYAADIKSFIKHQLSEPAILFGHSLGGWITLLAAAELREEVRALILGDPPLCMKRFLEYEGSDERQEMWRTMQRLAGSGLSVTELASGLGTLPVSVPGQDQPIYYGDLPGISEEHLLDWAYTISQVDQGVAEYHAEGRLEEYVKNVDLDSLLGKINCPVLLLRGDPPQGGVVTKKDVDYALSLLQNGSQVKLEGAGHDLGLGTGQVEHLLRAVGNFLKSV